LPGRIFEDPLLRHPWFQPSGRTRVRAILDPTNFAGFISLTRRPC
jgi:hypothetical protein